MAGRRIGWDPWRALRARDHLVLGITDLPEFVTGAVYWPRGSQAAIMLDRSLTRIERLEALAHELVHDEQGGGCDCDGMPEAWLTVADRVEERVRNEVARRMVPLDVLAAHRDIAEANDLPAGVVDVAEWFDVSEATAARAIGLLKQR